MDLIDRDELELDTEWSDYYDRFTSYSQSQIKGAVEVKAIPIPDNATNGDVIKSIYCQYGLVIRFIPSGEVVVDMTKLKNNGMIPNMAFNEDWWNAPYRKEVEE